MSLKSIALPWVAGLLLQGVVVCVLLLKKMWNKFPYFITYSLSNFVWGIGLYAVYHSSLSPRTYFYLYWTNEILGMGLGLGVVYEIFGHLLAPYPALRRLARAVFPASILLLILLGSIVAFAQPAADHYPVLRGLLVTEEGTRVLEVGLLLSLFAFASAFGLHWRQYVFGIAIGLGIFATVELVAIAMRVQFGFSSLPVFNIVRAVAFNSSLIIWVSYLLAPELATRPAELPKRAQLEQWNRAIMELIYQ